MFTYHETFRNGSSLVQLYSLTMPGSTPSVPNKPGRSLWLHCFVEDGLWSVSRSTLRGNVQVVPRAVPTHDHRV